MTDESNRQDGDGDGPANWQDTENQRMADELERRLKAPQSREAAESAGESNLCEHGNPPSVWCQYCVPILPAPPKPAPDAMRTLSVHQFVSEYEFRGEGGSGYAPTEYERAIIEDAIEDYLASAPVPPADGASALEVVDAVIDQFLNDKRVLYPDSEVLIALGKIRDAIWSPSSTIAAQPTLSPDTLARLAMLDASKEEIDEALKKIGTGAAEPVAWRYETHLRTDTGSECWDKRVGFTRPEEKWGFRNIEPLYATPPVRGDRETWAKIIDPLPFAKLKELDNRGAPQNVRGRSAWQARANTALEIADKLLLSLPVQPGAGEREAAKNLCGFKITDGKCAECGALIYQECLGPRQAPHSSRETET